MSYHVTGLISALTFLLTIGGLWSQLRLVWKRKQSLAAGGFPQPDRPTAILSLNQFLSSFLAFFSFFLYGACLQPLNHYLVWPRLVASLLTLLVLHEIRQDRNEWRSTVSFLGCAALLILAPIVLLVDPSIRAWGRTGSQALIVLVAIILAQGYSHQIVLIRRSGETGAVALRLHQFFFLKDASTIAFAVTMGAASGWPLLLMSSVSGLTKLATMWHFRWARLSPLARQRREARLRSKPGLTAPQAGVSAFPVPGA